MVRVIDSVTNFGIVTVSTTYDASATSVVLTGGHGARLPDTATSTAFNLTWWNATDFSDPADDPNKEIVRCTARSTDTLTVTRAQEGTAASTKNTAAKVYRMVLSPTQKTIDDINTELERQVTTGVDTINPTGFIDNENITVSYNFTNRTVTLTGTLTYYWQGVKKTLTSPWTSSAHTASVGTWFLSSTDGTNFTWSNTVWTFDHLMVAYVYYGGTAVTSFCLREVHGIMDFKSHEEFHSQIGTYRVSGGAPDAATYTENTATDAANTPGFDVAVIKDEDIRTTVPAWTQGTYTTMYIGASSTAVFNTTATLPFVSAGSYMQVNNTTTGAMTNGINNRYYNLYQILMPCASDSDSQKYRTLLLQPQATFTTLAAAQAEDIRGLSLGNIPNLSTEFVIFTRITYRTATGDGNTGKCRIATGGISYVLGNKAVVASVTGFTPTDHSVLTNLDWLNTGHTGTASSVAGFNGSGVATEYALDTDLTSVSGSDDTVPSAKATKTALDLKVVANADIVGATKTKITYDAKGLVTSGADATTADIADSTNKRYVSDAQLTVIGNTSGTNTGDQTLPVKATGAEINTGTDDAKFATAKAIADSTILKTTGGTLTGEVNLGENAGLALDALLSTDGKYSGIVEVGTLGETLSFGHLCYFKASDSKWWKTDANAAGTSGDVKIGMCVVAGNADAATKILLWGKINAASLFPSLTISAPVYIGETAGEIVVTQPTTADVVIRKIGFANTGDELFFCPDNIYVTHT